jgi:hypothetical protein
MTDLTFAAGQQLGLGVSAALSVIVTLCALPGCSAMTSHGPNSRMLKNASVSAVGFSYYLPKRMARVVFERFEIDKEASRKLAEKSAELLKSQALAAQAKLAVTDATLLRDKLAALRDPPAKALNEAQAQLAAAEVANAVAERGIAVATQAVLSAQAAVESAKRGDRMCGYADRFTISLLAPVADPDKHYVIEPRHTWFRKDEFNMKTTKAGLLSTVTSKVTDQTAEILVSLATAPAALRATSGAPSIRGTARTLVESATAATDPCMAAGKPRVLPIKVEEILDPTDSAALERLSVEITRKSKVGAAGTEKALFDDQYDLGALLPVLPNVSGIGKKDIASGVAYRRELPMLLYVFSRKVDVGNRCSAVPPRGDQCAILGSWQLEIPNGSPVEVLPAKATPFAQTTLKLEFDNGLLVSQDSVRPSEAARITALPVEYATSILEIPAKIIQLRVNLGNQKAALTTSETAAITAEIARLEALRKLDEARKANDLAEANDE